MLRNRVSSCAGRTPHGDSTPTRAGRRGSRPLREVDEREAPRPEKLNGDSDLRKTPDWEAGSSRDDEVLASR